MMKPFFFPTPCFSSLSLSLVAKLFLEVSKKAFALLPLLRHEFTSEIRTLRIFARDESCFPFSLFTLRAPSAEKCSFDFSHPYAFVLFSLLQRPNPSSFSEKRYVVQVGYSRWPHCIETSPLCRSIYFSFGFSFFFSPFAFSSLLFVAFPFSL